MRNMNTRTLLSIAALVLSPAALAAAENSTDASIAALEASLGSTHDLEIDEVRITGNGVACIEYRLRDAAGKQSRGHAVVQGKDVVRMPSGTNDDPEKFEKAWNDHCLGPHGGMTIDQ
jgi:hypothetical protein